jgi:septal ring factor EnvC (AmiA/AmiB activator)
MFQGTDFKEFIESKSDVEAIADEATRYRTAFNVLKRTGLTKERLLTTGQEYINIIDRDLTSFENAFNQQYKTDVEHKEQLLKQKAQELQALSEKISLLDTEMKQMSQQIVESKEKLNTNKNLFVVAGETKKQEIKTELQKIDTYFS